MVHFQCLEGRTGEYLFDNYIHKYYVDFQVIG